MLLFFLLNVLLLVSSYLAGCIPISFTLPTAKLRFLTIFGAGLLLGASLVIIIPEGVDALYANANNCHSRGKDISVGGIANRVKREAVELGQNLLPHQPAVPAPDVVNIGVSSNESHMFTVHQQVGIALLLGYMLMLLVDRLSSPLLESRFCLAGMHYLVGSCARRMVETLGSTEIEAAGNGVPTGCVPPGHCRKRSTATVGLVFHSFADGLALGVSFAVNQVQLEVIMFTAIILHKLPAAFGLACYLVHEGFTRSQIRVHLFLFSLASPMAALITYAYLVLPVDSSGRNELGLTSDKTGFALLLSGGTFLYVAATHILPELMNSVANPQPHQLLSVQQGPSDPWSSQPAVEPSTSENFKLYTVDAKHSTESGAFRPAEILVLCIGATLPVFLSSAHTH